MEDTYPTQIGNQIRNFGQPDHRQAIDPLSQAALFLSLAHAMDEQQVSLETELNTLRQREAHMFSKLSGDDPTDIPPSPPLGTIAPGNLGEGAANDFMIAERLRAWATLAANDSQSAWAYLTTSQPVMDKVLEIFPENLVLSRWPLGRHVPHGQTDPAITADIAEVLKQLAFSETFPASEPSAAEGGEILKESPGAPQIILYGIPGCTPQRFLERLYKRDGGNDGALHGDSKPAHTLIGLVRGV
jgi:hypothetical protein